MICCSGSLVWAQQHRLHMTADFPSLQMCLHVQPSVVSYILLSSLNYIAIHSGVISCTDCAPVQLELF